MLSLLIDKGWIGHRRAAKSCDRNGSPLLICGAAIAVAALLIIGGIVLATTTDFGASPHPPPIIKERIRLM